MKIFRCDDFGFDVLLADADHVVLNRVEDSLISMISERTGFRKKDF